MDEDAGTEGEGRREEMAGLAKGLSVLLAFNHDHPSLSLSEIATITGLAPATARRCLLTLQSLGYVGSVKRRFFLRPKVLDLGAAYLEALDIERLASVPLTELANATSDSASISVLDGEDIIYVARASVRTLVRLEAHVGSRFPAFATAMGRVLLAALPDPMLRAFLDKAAIAPITEKTVVDRDQLFDLITQVRKDGYCAVEDELAYGVVSLAVPLKDQGGRTIATLNSASHSKRYAKDQLVAERLDHLRGVAEQISRELRRLPSGNGLLPVADTVALGR
ncbi:IclR family transcriptional regulator domain-containing protein [Nitrospirillum viridazoti]|uniref:IclR family transcriptional regulator n=1 Tax=Nitrospirillum amazonense TaxID=28077 RepID=A0A560IMM7_9PROT|nr:IclR family transcriptional regulator C-terminal domain-containing protein [Nitrospirillum amazonense]TWB59621.1 IclR family transcriptional regulator [Nitrospirillum amazonense]